MKNVMYIVFLLGLICASNTLYAIPAAEIFTLLEIGIHYQGQPADTWVIKEVINGSEFTYQDGHVQPPIEIGIAGDLPAGVVDKLALKAIVSGSETGRGWMSDANAEEWLDSDTPPVDAYDLLAEQGGSPISLETNSNKKVIMQWYTQGDDTIVISDM